MAKASLGDEIKASLQRNCILCNRFMMCRDPNKDGGYACSKFSNDTPEDTIEHLQREAVRERREAKKRAKDISEETESDNDDHIIAMIEKIIESGETVTPDLKINDRDIKRPKNFMEWTTSTDFLFEEEQPPFSKQLQVGTHLFGEWCPRCSDADYMENIPYRHTVDRVKERVVFLENGRCPQCKAKKSELVAEDELYDYNELIGIAGQRSGKTITVTLMESYNTARWLTTPNIIQTFKFLPSTVLMGSYTALTFKQAKDNVWRPLKSIFDNSPWFRAYHKLLGEEGYKTGQQLFNLGEESLHYMHRNILLAPMSPSKRSMRGATRISAVIDELGWYPNGQTKSGQDFERLDAKEVYTALRRSLTTVRNAYSKRTAEGANNIPKSLMMNISSPSSVNDMIMTLHRRYENSKTVYAFKYPTWRFNPEYKRSSFDEEFRVNPVEAERDFGCNPPISVNAWLKDEAVALRMFSGRKNGMEVLSGKYRSKSTKILTSANYEVLNEYWPENSAILVLDAGLSNNSFAFSVMAPTNLPEEGDEDVGVGVEVFAVGEIIPKQDTQISFTHVYKNILLPLCNELPIAAVVSDRWQNIKMLQDLEEATGVSYFEWRLQYPDFKVFREGIYEGMVNLNKLDSNVTSVREMTLDNYPHSFNGKPMAHLLFQFLTVQDTGNAVIKGDGTDDIFRTIALGYTALQDPEVRELIEAYHDNNEMPRNDIGMVALGGRGAQQTGPVTGMGGAGIGIKLNTTQARGTSSSAGIGGTFSTAGRR